MLHIQSVKFKLWFFCLQLSFNVTLYSLNKPTLLIFIYMSMGIYRIWTQSVLVSKSTVVSHSEGLKTKHFTSFLNTKAHNRKEPVQKTNTA